MLKPRLIKILLNVVWLVLIVVTLFLFQDQVDLSQIDLRDFKLPHFILGISLGSIASLCSALVLKRFFPQFSWKNGWAKSFILTYLPAIGKYFPGVGWSVAGFVLQANAIAEIKKRDAVVYQIYFQLINGISSSILIILGVIIVGKHISGHGDCIIDIVSYIILFISIVSIIFVAKYLKKYGYSIKKNIYTDVLIISIQKIIKSFSLIIFILSWINIKKDFVLIIYSFVAAMQAGVLAFFAPAGIGVTEGVYTFVLAGSYGLDDAVKIALIARILQLLIDILLATLSFLIKVFYLRI